MYPLNMTSAAGGYAVANTEEEHIALTAAGYGPAFVAPPVAASTASAPAAPASEDEAKAALTAKAEELGIKVDARWGVKRLEDEIAKHG